MSFEYNHSFFYLNHVLCFTQPPRRKLWDVTFCLLYSGDRRKKNSVYEIRVYKNFSTGGRTDQIWEKKILSL